MRIAAFLVLVLGLASAVHAQSAWQVTISGPGPAQTFLIQNGIGVFGLPSYMGSLRAGGKDICIWQSPAGPQATSGVTIGFDGGVSGRLSASLQVSGSQGMFSGTVPIMQSVIVPGPPGGIGTATQVPSGNTMTISVTAVP